jgi:DNA mismatch repair protein MutS
VPGAAETPLMRQYLALKGRYPDAILFYRLGDFYEMFFEDAVVASEALELTLTSRNKGDPDEVPMCGVPHHSAHTYLARLVEAGHKVAVCEQMEDPAKAKGIVRREVVRVVTPGVAIDPEVLDPGAPRYLAGVAQGGGLAFLDVSTGDLRATDVADGAAALSEVARLEAKEVLLSPAADESLARSFAAVARVERRPDAPVEALADLDADAREALATLSGPARAAAANVLAYVRDTQPAHGLPPIRVTAYRSADRLVLDEAARRHLEILRTMGGERKGSLLGLVDQTVTAPGARRLRDDLLAPLMAPPEIARRLDVVEALATDPARRDALGEALAGVADVERIASRAALGAATPRELRALGDALGRTPDLVRALAGVEPLEALAPPLAPAVEALAAGIRDAMVEAPPPLSTGGGLFRRGWDARLDEVIALAEGGKDLLFALEAKEREASGIGSLKLRYNRVFGYYLEVTKANLSRVPPHFVRKQTVATGERYTTEALETLQARLLTAEERRKEIEKDLFDSLVARVASVAHALARWAGRVAELDARRALAVVAHRGGWTRPVVDGGLRLEIRDGRHPVVEALDPAGAFVPNDVVVDAGDGPSLLVITGPNMAGKSTVLRQTALSAILAQTGSFVPARSARLGAIDRVFTRVGASDDLAGGRSTFMVEMREAAEILRSATRRSLVVLDEVGRGTSTFDGLSIAWAIGEHLHDAIRCRALFATHYHELVALAASRPRVANFNVSAREHGGDVVFLRKLVPGGASHSYGIQVARMAGLPASVLARARAVLEALESGTFEARTAGAQLDLFAAPAPAPPPADPVRERLAAVDVDATTPLDALRILAELKRL